MMTLQERVHGVLPPASWQPGKLHRVFRARKGVKNAGMQEDNLLSLSYGRIIQKDIDTAEGLLPESFETYQIVEPGNIVMRLTDLQNDKRSLRQGLVTQRGIITSAYDALEVGKDHNSRFWVYALLALDLAKYYYSLGGGVRQSIKFADFPNEWIGVPNPETQKRIGDFLDRETTRIDQLIEKKQRMVELLGEKLERQNVECITLGLNTDVRKRTTDIEWAHEIPVHWAVANLRQLFASAEYGISESMSDEGEIAVLRMGNIQDGEIVCNSLGFVDRVDRRLTLRSGDLLFNRTNSRDLVGKVGIFRRSDGDKFSFASYLVRIRPSEITQSEYLNLLLNSRPVLGAARALAIPSISQSNLNPNRYGSMPVPLPPVGEQKEIAAHLSLLISKNSDIERCIRSSLARLRELRAALITAAVTGQIDVATWGKRGQTDRRLDAIEVDMTAAAQPERQQARA